MSSPVFNQKEKSVTPTVDFIVVMCSLIIFFELYAYHTQGVYTVSEQMRAWHEVSPMLPLMFAYGCGILTGHFFWNIQK